MNRTTTIGAPGARPVAALRALAIAAVLAGTAFAQSPVYQEQGGLLVLEMESAAPTGGWVAETQHAGFTGKSYYRWNGGNQYSKGGKGVLRFDFDVHNPGKFELAMHNRHDHASSSEENDVWVRIDGAAWTKCYSNKGASTVKQWNWHTVFEVGSNHKTPIFNLTSGAHVIEFSGRSQNFKLDRVHVFHPTHPDGRNKSVPPSLPATTVSKYCSAKLTSAGCLARLGWTGTPSASGSGTFMVQASKVPNQKPGLLFYGYAPASTPFLGGTLCVSPPLVRLQALPSGGAASGNDCSGSLAAEMNGRIRGGADENLVPGTEVCMQSWFRDVGGAHGLSDGLRFTIQP